MILSIHVDALQESLNRKWERQHLNYLHQGFSRTDRIIAQAAKLKMGTAVSIDLLHKDVKEKRRFRSFL
jgi:hypothetical protein